MNRDVERGGPTGNVNGWQLGVKSRKWKTTSERTIERTGGQPNWVCHQSRMVWQKKSAPMVCVLWSVSFLLLFWCSNQTNWWWHLMTSMKFCCPMQAFVKRIGIIFLPFFLCKNFWKSFFHLTWPEQQCSVKLPMQCFCKLLCTTDSAALKLTKFDFCGGSSWANTHWHKQQSNEKQFCQCCCITIGLVNGSGCLASSAQIDREDFCSGHETQFCQNKTKFDWQCVVCSLCFWWSKVFTMHMSCLIINKATMHWEKAFGFAHLVVKSQKMSQPKFQQNQKMTIQQAFPVAPGRLGPHKQTLSENLMLCECCQLDVALGSLQFISVLLESTQFTHQNFISQNWELHTFFCVNFQLSLHQLNSVHLSALWSTTWFTENFGNSLFCQSHICPPWPHLPGEWWQFWFVDSATNEPAELWEKPLSFTRCTGRQSETREDLWARWRRQEEQQQC